MTPWKSRWRGASAWGFVCFVAAASVADPVQSQQFNTPYVGYDAGSYAGFLRTMDVDGDGCLDVVVCNTAPPAGPSIAVLHGDGRGRFASPRHYATARTPGYFIVRDFNGDDVEDLAVVCRDDSALSILFGTGAGAFQPRLDMKLPGAPSWLDTGDLDGDGHEDLAVTLRNRSVAILRGDSEGHFVLAGEVMQASIAAAAPGDLDQDGDLDLAVAGGRVLWRWNRGDGTFTDVEGYSTRVRGGAMMVKDFDSDGVPDILTLNGTGPCMLLTRFERLLVLQFEYSGKSVANSSLHLAHVDDDGVKDIVAGSNVFFGRGDTDFETGAAFLHAGAYVDAADVDGDGVQDLVGVRQGDQWGHTGTLHVLRGRGERQFGLPEDWLWGTAAGPVDFVPADVNADGNLDVVVAGFAGEVITAHLGDGQGRFGRGIDTRPGGWGPADIAVARLDEDAFPDLVVMNQWTYTLSIQAGRGDGTFVTANTLTRNHSLRFHLADFNADGLLDILPDEDTCSFVVYLGQGHFTFRSILQSSETSILLDRLAQSDVADVNSDGFLDIVGIIPNDNRAAVLFGAADGQFTPGPVFGVSPGATDCELGDLNEDGRPDLGICTWLDRATVLEIWSGNGDGTFARSGATTLDLIPGNLRFVDADGDSHLDAIVLARYSYITVLPGRGDGTFGPRINYGIDASHHEIADWNGDGIQDLGTLQGNRFGVILGQRPTPIPVAASLDMLQDAGSPVLLLRIDPGSLGRLSQVRIERGGGPDGPYTTIATSEPQARIELHDQEAPDGEIWYRAVLYGRTGDVVLVGPVRRLSGPFVTALQPIVNPADGSRIAIEYTLRRQSLVDLRIVDVRGRLVTSLDWGVRASGLHHVDWNREDARGVVAARGFYFVVLQATGESHVRRVLLLRP